MGTRYISMIAAAITNTLCACAIVIYGYLTGVLNANILTLATAAWVSVLFSAMPLDQLDDIPTPVLHYMLACPCIFFMALSILNSQTVKWILLFFTIFTIAHTVVLVINKTEKRFCFLFSILSVFFSIGSYFIRP